MRKFDTKIQYLKYKVLREVAKEAWEGTLLNNIYDIPKRIVPGPKPTMRCCVYKERADIEERIKLVMGGDPKDENVIQVISLACDECPTAGHEVTSTCRGCLAHRCEDVCKRGAISFDENQVAHIDKSKCIECGKCAAVCPYSAIINRKRPCQMACKAKAIQINEDDAACIDYEKCTSCGACVYTCPFGAIMDKSYILKVIDMLQRSVRESSFKVLAVVAPAIASQFTYAKLGQVVSGIKKLGFYSVTEAALGADLVAAEESRELVERGFLTSSCCPAFVNYIKANYPQLSQYISSSLSPMATIAKYLKENTKNCAVVFIGPCTAKKKEVLSDEVRPYVDAVLTFEELQALFDSRDIDITTLPEDELNNASYFGRIFARCGGLSDAVQEAILERGEKFEVKPISCNGIDECKIALLKKSKNVLDANFIEGMACVGGCVGGAGCLTHGEKNREYVEKHGMEVWEKTIADVISQLT